MDRKDKTLESVMILVGMILNIRSTTIKTLDFDLEMLPESSSLVNIVILMIDGNDSS